MIIRNNIIKISVILFSLVLITTHSLQVIRSGWTLDQAELVILILFVISLVTENRVLYSISCMMQGILTTLTITGLTELSPFIFFFLAIAYGWKSKILLAIPVLFISSYLISYHINGFDNYINLIEGMLGNLFFTALFTLLFLKQPEDIKRLAETTPLNVRQLLILKQLAKDIPRKQIPASVKDITLWRLGLERDKFTLDIINTEIAKIKKKLEVKNNEICLGVWYNKQIEIPRNL